MLEPSRELDAIARAAIGAALEVHRLLGPGFLESVYEEALAIELELRRIWSGKKSLPCLTRDAWRVRVSSISYLRAS